MQHPYSFLILVLLLFSNLTLYGQDEPLIIEAESGSLGADFIILEEGDIQYVSPQTDFLDVGFPGSSEKVITYELSFPAAGTYDLYARLRVGPASAEDDSFFIGSGFGDKSVTNADEWITVNQLHTAGFVAAGDVVRGGAGQDGIAPSEVWKWINVSEFSQAEANLTFTVEEENLTQVFQIGSREDGLDIDKIAFAPSELFYTVSNLDNGEAGSSDFPDPDAGGPPIAEGQEKFLGNIYSPTQLAGFTEYWNQVTPENAGKWGSVEGTRDQMNWGGLDAAYQLAQENGFPFRFHVMIWGNQQPDWLRDLAPAEQLEEIEEWFAAVAERYPDLEFIEVVNEPLHDPPSQNDSGGGNYIEALGGAGTTGWDWIITSFELARQYFPNARLMINDYNIIGSQTNTEENIEIINLLQERNLIDAVGFQAHAFSTRDASVATLSANLDRLAETGLPVYITEMDIDGPTDAVQLREYQRVFPVFWEHEAVAGITLWGYRPGLWRETANLLNADGTERPALTWLRAYVNGEYVPISSVELSADAETVEVDGTVQLTAAVTPEDATIETIIWSVEPETGSGGEATIDENGLLTGVEAGNVVVTATSLDGNLSDEMVIEIMGEDPVTALKPEELARLSVYPNPVMNNSVISLEGIEKINRLRLLTLNGRQLKEWDVSDKSSAEIQLNVQPGLYLIQLYDGQGFISRKIVVQ